MIKYNKDMIWAKPFLEEVKHLIPFKRITNLRGYRVKKNQTELTDGSTVKDGRKIAINVLIYSYIKTNRKYRKKTLHYVLDTLAHELAHTVHWEHTPEHYKLQGQIMTHFSKVLKRRGITDTSKRYHKELK